MASPVVTLTFTDGRTESVRLSPRVLVEAERRFGDMAKHPIEGTLYGAWFRLGRPGNFDEWMDSVELMEQEQPEEAVPTLPEASDGS